MTVAPTKDTGRGYRTRRRTERARRRDVVNRHLKTAIDPAAQPTTERLRPVPMIVFLGVSLLVHPALAAVLSLLPASKAHRENYQPVEIRIAELPPPPPPPRVEPPPPPPKVEPPKIEARRVEARVEPKLAPSEPPPDPVAEPVTADLPQAHPTEPPRRVVGISMESTTTGGTGPAFAAGNTRMGSTSNAAQSPGPSAPSSSFVPPRRTFNKEPAYPTSLRARGIEGEVGLSVEIDPTGQVTKVTVTRPSEHPEFDDAAFDSATRGTYDPARRDGVAVAYAIEFTMRFRLH